MQPSASVCWISANTLGPNSKPPWRLGCMTRNSCASCSAAITSSATFSSASACAARSASNGTSARARATSSSGEILVVCSIDSPMVVREEVAGRQRFSGGSPCMTRDGFFGAGRGATSSEWISRAGSVGFVDLEQGLGGLRKAREWL